MTEKLSTPAIEYAVLVERIRPILAGQKPEIVGATLAHLVATFLAGHAPPLRKIERELLLGLIDELVPSALRS